jgi:lysyl-tRNA synthetase class 2
MRKLLGVPRVSALALRAEIVSELRRFFGERGYLEIEPPALLPTTGLEIHISSLETSVRVPASLASGATVARPGYLHTSPEYALKKLLACGYDRVFSVCKVFRDGEVSERHNVEFTMCEWYQVGADAEQLMQETEALVRALAARVPTPPVLEAPFRRLSFRDAFLELGIDFDRIGEHDAAAFRDAAARVVRVSPDDAFDDVFHRVCLEKIDPTLKGAVFVHDYPVELAVLSRRNPARQRYAERFELFVDGLELCNGFSELTDPVEQRARFVAEQDERRRRGLPVYALDEAFLTALSALPRCAGNALGLDRLVMLLSGAQSIDEVMAFSSRRLFAT